MAGQLQPGTLLGPGQRYEIVKHLNNGGSAVVYSGEQVDESADLPSGVGLC